MQIDLSNPITIIGYLVFVLGGSIWIEWFKRQIELSAKDPKKASELANRLSKAAKKQIFLIINLLLLSGVVVGLVIASQEFLQRDKLLGLALIFANISVGLHILGFSRGDNLLNDLGSVGFASFSITYGIWLATNFEKEVGAALAIIASINLLRTIIKIIRTNYQVEAKTASKKPIYSLVIFVLFILITMVLLDMQLSIKSFSPIYIILLLLSVIVYAVYLKKESKQYRIMYKILLSLMGILISLELMEAYSIELGGALFLGYSIILSMWSSSLVEYYFPEEKTIQTKKFNRAVKNK